jgi:uncharacterized protein YggE
VRLRYLLLAAVPVTLNAQVVRDSIITVTASRTARIAADRASLYVTLEGTAETATDAIARVDTKIKGVTDALKALGARVVFEPPIAYSVGPTPAPNGFPGVATPASNLARTVIRVNVSGSEHLAHIIAAVLGAGAVSTSSVTFEATAADSVRRTRMAEALAVARLDAAAIAASLGGQLGALVDVSTTGNLLTGFQQPTVLNFDNRFGQQSMAPEVAITTNVTVRYRLVR